MYSVMQEFYGQLNERNIVSLRGWVHLADRSIPKLNSSEVPDNSNVNSQLDRTWRVNAEWRHHYSKGTVVAMAGLNLQDLDYSLTTQINGQAPYTAINSVSRSSSYINRIELKHDFSPTSTFSFNANYNYHDAQTQEDVKKTGYLKDRHEINAYAAYQRSFSDRANLKLSLRQDYIDHELIPLIPYAGFDYRVWARKDFFVKANVVRNYHVPTLNDLYWQPGGNPLLKPEYGLTEEAGVAWLTKRRHVVLETQVTGYYSDIADWILWVPTVRGYWVPLNVKRVVSKGIEVSINIKYVRGPWKFTLNTNYALTRSLNYGDRKTWGDESYGKQLVYIPIHSGNLFINARYKSTSITWQHNSYSKRFTTSSNDVKHTGSLTDYFMNQLYVAQEFKFKKFGFEAQLKVYNLFDEYYRSVLARRMPERNYMLLLMFKF
jgi:outer membrane cobalamin receptor